VYPSNRFFPTFILKIAIMKKLVILPALILVGLYGHATTFIVTVSNNQFSPANIPNVVVGDVLQFNFAPVNLHNVVTNPLGSVPSGAADMNSGSAGSVTTSYSYTVTVAGNYRYYCEVHSSDGVTGMVGTFTASAVVPVQLKNFDVAYSNRTVIASWQTATEQNLSYFSLEKSTDGKNYKEAGRVTATGEGGTQQSYTYRDDRLDMNAKYIYYMLRMVDKDGSYELSPVKLVRNEQAVNKLITQIGPNPVSRAVGHLMLQFNADKDTEMKVLVIDAGGKIVMNLDMTANKGINNGHIHMADLPAGVYTIIFSMDGIKEIHKTVVR
jgi:plastocyanin